MRLGPGDNMMVVAAAASTREPHLRSFINCACVDVFIISEFVSLPFSFFLLSLTNIYSLPLVRIRSSHDSPVVTVNWSIIITLYYTSRAVVMQALYSLFRYFSKTKGERNFANIEQILRHFYSLIPAASPGIFSTDVPTELPTLSTTFMQGRM